MRDILDKSLKDAMRARDSQKISTIRLINAAIKDRDIAVRSEDNLEGVSDEEILSILSKMIKQRQESAKQYEAVCTPDFFGYDKDFGLQYRGRIRELRELKPVRSGDSDLFIAMKKVSETGKGPEEQFPSMGCGIKWSSN